MTNRIQNEVCLKKGELLKVRWAEGEPLLRVEQGCAWVTLEGCPDDFVLKRGDTFPAKAGELLVEALEDLKLTTGAVPCRAPCYALSG